MIINISLFERLLHRLHLLPTPVVDAFGEIDRRGDRTALFMDGVHLNERGDRLISELIFAAIHDRAW